MDPVRLQFCTKTKIRPRGKSKPAPRPVHTTGRCCSPVVMKGSPEAQRGPLEKTSADIKCSRSARRGRTFAADHVSWEASCSISIAKIAHRRAAVETCRG
ncbi:hypothetical protein EYF80_046515 [Liparis tanakae]|uniref:Uncharacterized protein n=1 Tax=Liparis tanakae TaxID=230148 RepID=A0A4Z2FQU3_9TELE|nr:hypothetical protein EYF80_046515 [Liparis tanakae]